MQILAAVTIGLVGWLCYRSIAHDAQIQATQYQISAIIATQTNVIPPVVESSLRELRDKTNSDRDMIARLTEIATGNSKDIGYLKERLPK